MNKTIVQFPALRTSRTHLPVRLAVVGIAAWIPARRASRVDPMGALRAE